MLMHAWSAYNATRCDGGTLFVYADVSVLLMFY